MGSPGRNTTFDRAASSDRRQSVSWSWEDLPAIIAAFISDDFIGEANSQIAHVTKAIGLIAKAADLAEAALKHFG
jgi:hypothetical protein